MKRPKRGTLKMFVPSQAKVTPNLARQGKKMVTVRMNVDEAALLIRAASKLDISLEGFIRESALDTARRALMGMAEAASTPAAEEASDSPLD